MNDSGADGMRGTHPKTYETKGPLAGLWVRTANVLRNAGYDTKNKARDAVLSGRLQAHNGLNWFGPIMYAETLAWLGLDEARVLRHQNQSAHLPPLSERMLEFVAPDFPPPTALPKYESSYRYYVFAWNLAVLPPKSSLAQMFENGIASLPDEIRVPAEQHLAELIRRKREMFPDDHRIIGECLPVTVDGEVRLRVAWTTPEGLTEVRPE